MTARYDIRRRALSELDAIREYTHSAWGAAQARRYIAELRQTFVAAAQHPTRYPFVEGRLDGLRRARSGSHIIIFTTSEQRIEIVRILHERMDIDAQLEA